MEDNTLTNPKSRQMALNAIGSHPGWPIYCDRFEQLIKANIDAKIFDLKTSDEDRRTLVAARELLATNYTPEKIRQSLLVVAESDVRRMENARSV